MYKPALIFGCVFALLSVILGAFGAHYLKTIFTTDLLHSFETGVKYQFYHSIALLFAGLFAKENPHNKRWISMSFIIGIILFSGSIYLLCFLKNTDIVGLNGIGICTPMGGLLFILGWILLLIAILKKQINK